MFSERYKGIDLNDVLLQREEYHPFPTVLERDSWERLPDKLKRDMIKEGEKYIDFAWPTLPAVRFMDYKRDGNRSKYEAFHFERRKALAYLVLAQCIEGGDRFLDDIINGIWCICEESFWGVPAHNYNSRDLNSVLPDISEPIIDLFAAETGGLMAWVVYLLQVKLDKVTPLICERIRTETKRRILNPFMERNDFWWMGYNLDRKVNNWNPWILSNCITTFLILEEELDRRGKAVTKILDSLDKFMDIYEPDGGCDEGTSYWGRAGASLFDCLEQLYAASNGKINFFEESKVKEIGRFIYKSYIDKDYFINFADGGARVKIDSDLVYRYGKYIGDTKLMAMGSKAYHSNPNEMNGRPSLLRELPRLFNFSELNSAENNAPYLRDSWLPGIQVMAAREKEGSSEGLYLAAKGGNNDESHNHNDIGQFIIYANGKPAIIDIGVETYTAKTFSPQRYDIWTMQSSYHNLPTINGLGQQAGENYKATEVKYNVDEALTELSMDIKSAYPKEVGIDYWKRSFKMHHEQKPCIQVIDCFRLNKASEDVMISLMTPIQPIIDDKGDILLDNGIEKVHVGFDGSSLQGSVEYITIKDERLMPIWGDHLYRIILKVKSAVVEGKWELKVTKE